MTNIQAVNGGRSEVPGGVCTEHGHDFSPEIPVLRYVDSSLGYVGCTNGPNRFEVIVEDTIGDQTQRTTRTDCPPRPGTDGHTSWKDIVVPLMRNLSPTGAGEDLRGSARHGLEGPVTSVAK